MMLGDKAVIITGAGGEIGRAAARLFAKEGANLLLADLSLEAAEASAHAISGQAGKIVTTKVDITNLDSVDAMITRCAREFQQLDCAFNNAGINLPADVNWELDAFDLSMTVNANGTMYCMTAQSKLMAAAGKGSIVNNASAMGIVGSTRQPGYAASKHAVIGLTRTAAIRWGGQGIRVNAVCPGSVNTPMTERSMAISPQLRTRLLSMAPMGRLAEPHEVAEAALWLCSDRASFINGVALPVDGGFTAG
jgi:NAD(P)-dependent dehydrogenase (short-subunit alcohol dehydrogenase family)